MRPPRSRVQELRQQISWSRIGVEIGVVALDAAAFAGLGRLFTSAQPMAAIIVAVLLTHGIAITCRAARVPGPVAALVSFVALGIAVCASAFPETMRLGLIPSSQSAVEVRLALVDAWDRFTTVRAPTEPLLGFTLIAIAAAWMVGTVSDTIAFRLRYLTEASVPPTVVLVVTSALAPPRYRVQVILGFAAAAALLAVSARSRELNRAAWLGGRPRHRSAMQAVAVAAIGLAVAAMVAQRPPTWAVDGIVDWRTDQGGGDGGAAETLAINPLVSTRARLVDQSDVEMFRVRTDRPTYWRQTSLDLYEDEAWTGGPIALPRQKPGNLGGYAAGQLWTGDLEILALRSPWLPVADRVLQVADPSGANDDDVGIDTGTGAAVMRTDLEAGRRFFVTSGPRDESQAADLTEKRRAELTALPDTVSPRVGALARAVTADADSPLASARALEQFFQSEFVYDLDVARSGPVTLESFLFVGKRGYCEQFAGAFAVMARTLGIPARVAVGFVPGESEESGSMLVRGRDAHAWPEVLLDGGWVPFEPTPGRGTGSGETTPSTTAPTTTVAPAGQAAAPTTTTAPLDTDLLDPIPQAPPSRGGKALGWLLPLLGAALLLSAPTLVRRMRLGALPVEPVQQVVRAWNLVEDDLAWLRLPRPPHEPLDHYARRLQLADPAHLAMNPSLVSLAERVEAVQYAPVTEPVEVAALLAALASLHSSLAATLPPATKLRRAMAFGFRPTPTAAAV